jgi:hypothetical protein
MQKMGEIRIEDGNDNLKAIKQTKSAEKVF